MNIGTATCQHCEKEFHYSSILGNVECPHCMQTTYVDVNEVETIPEEPAMDGGEVL